MLSKEKLRRADIVTSILLIAMGVAVISGGMQMPRAGTYGGIEIRWYTSPAFFPVFLGLSLVLCAVGVLVRALADGGQHQLLRHIKNTIRSLPENISARRIVLIWVLLLGYILCLSLHPFGGLGESLESLGRSRLTAFVVEPEGANYVVSSFLFLTLFMFVFYRTAEVSWSWTRWLLILGIGASAAWGVGYLFTQHLYSPLPW